MISRGLPSRVTVRADRRPIGAELRAPVGSRQDDGVGATGRVVRSGKDTAEHRLDGENRQQPVRREQRRHFLRLGHAGHADRSGAPHGDVLEGPPVLTIGEVQERGGARPRHVEAGSREIERHQLAGARIRQGLQQHPGDDAENRGVGADAEGEGQHGHAGEQRHRRQVTHDVSPAHGGITRGGASRGARFGATARLLDCHWTRPARKPLPVPRPRAGHWVILQLPQRRFVLGLCPRQSGVCA